MEDQVLFTVDEDTFARLEEWLDGAPTNSERDGLARLMAVQPPWEMEELQAPPK